MQGGDSLRIEFTLEVRDDFRQLHRRFHAFKFLRRTKNILHLLEIYRVIRPQINYAIRRERGAGELGKTFVDEPQPVMFFLRPRIGEINMQCGRRVRRQQVLQEIRGLDADAAQVGQSGATAFAVEFLDATQQPFDPNVILLWIAPGIFNEKRGIATTEFNFQRPAFRKQPGQGERLNDGTKLDDKTFRVGKWTCLDLVDRV